MAALSAARRTVASAPSCTARCIPAAVDYTYVKMGRETSKHYTNLMDEGMEKMKEFPVFISHYLKVAEVMQAKGLIPVVHAQPSAYRVPRIFMETMSGRSEESHFHYLRAPSSKFMIDRETIMERVKAYVTEHGDCGWTPGEWNFNISRLDTDPAFRPFLLSVSYSMMDFTRGESAFDFLFRNSAIRVNSIRAASEAMIVSYMKMRGRESKIAQVLEKLALVYDDYCALDINTLFVIGVPEDKVSRYMYDAKSFGVPTGDDIVSIAKKPWTSSRAFTIDEGGLQARLLMYKETMDPASGIEVVDINNESEVARYSTGHCTTTKDMSEFARFFPSAATRVEEKCMAETRRLDQYVAGLALSL